ncbi:hypothetical protein MUK42_28289 [Musa troglodytarum]|uniref:Uncharacterized protein n=1 Tax=Musa troglodytarum TaxID=320322 RepID=A0A9E7G315_9LILI|nr:hypothetical protein MUK42_28289 [Musa troglodytarum]
MGDPRWPGFQAMLTMGLPIADYYMDPRASSSNAFTVAGLPGGSGPAGFGAIDSGWPGIQAILNPILPPNPVRMVNPSNRSDNSRTHPWSRWISRTSITYISHEKRIIWLHRVHSDASHAKETLWLGCLTENHENRVRLGKVRARRWLLLQLGPEG